jgi:allantoinase
MYTEARDRGFGLPDIARWMSERSAKLAGCHATKGRLAAGYDADFVVFDTEGEFIVTEDRLHYRHPVSPYLGEKFHGIVKATYLRGHLIFENGEFPGQAVGREYSGVALNKLASQPSFL